MAAVQSGYVEIDAKTETEDASVPDLGISIAGDFQTPDRSHLTMGISSGGISITLEIIVIGEESYVKSPFADAWESNLENLTPFENVLDFGAFNTDFDPEVVEGFNLVGEEQLDGEHVYHLKGTVSGEALADLLDDLQVGDGKGEVEYWIGVQDFLVRKTAIQAELSADDGGTNALKMQIVMTLSDYGKPVDIQAPES